MAERKVELLVPAGSLEVLKVAVDMVRMQSILADRHMDFVQKQIIFRLKK